MEENIRDPDQPFYDRLIETPNAPIDYADELEYALQQSIEEYELQQKYIEAELFEKEKQERLYKFDNVKKMCRRLIAISPNDRSTLELFLYFIELYETDYMNTIDVEPAFYKQVFSILETTRLSKEDIELCKSFINIVNV